MKRTICPALRRFALSAASAALSLVLLCVAAQAVFEEQDGKSSDYTSVLYNSSNGLPTSDVNAVVQSAEGFIWIGSYSGLIRYDGNAFYRYDSSTGVSSVVSLCADSQGRLWVGTNDSGVGMLKDEQFTFYDREQGLRSSSVRSIVEDAQGNILVATTMGIAYIDTNGEMHVLDDPQINREYVCELVRGENGVVYGVTNAGGFFTIEDLRLTAFYSSDVLEAGIVNTVYPDPDRPGWVYLGTQDSAVIYGDLTDGMKACRQFSVEPLHYVNSIRKLNGLIWVCSDNGIGFLDSRYRYTQVTDLPMTNSIEHILSDYEGNLWFTSSRQGLLKIVPNRFANISASAELPPLVVNSTCLHDGLLYIGADTGLTILDKDYSQVTNELTELLDGVRIRCIKADSTGAMWFCTNSDNGLVRYDAKSGAYTIYNVDSGLASNRARMVFELHDGTLAVATNAGVNLIRDGKIVATYDSAQGISNLEILCIEEAPDGRLYLGSDGDGIYILDGGKVSRLGRDDGLPSEVILRLKRDAEEEGLYWIITSNSIAYMRDDKITAVRRFPYSNNFDLYFDDDGRIWVLSSNGIYVVKREDMLADEKIDYTLYDTKCGLPATATPNSYSHFSADGTLYIAGSTGVGRVNIYNDTDNNSQVRLAVPFLTADDAYVSVPADGEVHISKNCKRLNIYAYAFTYSLLNPRLSYCLEGFDDAPVELTKQELSRVSYTNLPGGTYHFRLRLLNTMTGEADQELDVTIVKEKTLYEQAWFPALVATLGALFAALVVVLIYQRKTRALLRKQAENKQLINEMSSVFANCIDMKDPYTNGHSHRVAKYTMMLAERLGKTKEEAEEMYNIALLHDIGKISIPDEVLHKPERLTDEEFAIMKNHSARGYEILKDITIDPNLAIGAGYHHERVDGKGYPRGVKGDEIPEVAQIIAVADTFDAMYSTRPYRKKLPLDTVANEIQRISGTQLNSKVVDAFMQLVHEDAFDNE
ncbi:MAG: HD domain-containing protein [Ruminococcaceae bacterium]|jgi:energy-coupling factor transport system substrate-specific component|nr:HD domain-containing protein [Oscillospiraceae bacterium]